MPETFTTAPEIIPPEEINNRRVIKWCDGHWAELMFALNDRGLGNDIAPDAEALNAKLMRGQTDPCWDACNRLNMGAMEIFGPDKVIAENGGCPACAFANIVQHVADLSAMQYKAQ